MAVVGGDAEGGEFGVDCGPFAAHALVSGSLPVVRGLVDALGGVPEGVQAGTRSEPHSGCGGVRLAHGGQSSMVFCRVSMMVMVSGVVIVNVWVRV